MAKFLLGVWNGFAIGVVAGAVGLMYAEACVWGKDPQKGHDMVDSFVKARKEYEQKEAENESFKIVEDK